MKEKWKEMSKGRHVLLIALAGMAVGFALIFLIWGLRSGVWYRDYFLYRTERDGNTLYAGNVQGKDMTFTVTPQGQVTLRVGEQTYGPFTVTEGSTVISGQSESRGVTLTEGDKQIFKGEFRKSGENDWLVDEAGEFWTGESPFFFRGDPTFGTEEWDDLPYNLIVRLVMEPPIRTRAEFGYYWLGLLVLALTAATVIWEDAIYRFELSFRVRDPEKAEPSDWEMMGRWIGWGLSILMALFLFALGFGM